MNSLRKNLFFRLIIIGTAFQIACSPVEPKGRRQLSGFHTMEIPRSQVPLGANWIQGRGPNGVATSADNIEVTRSFDLSSTSREFKQSLDASILKYFNLDQSADTSAEVTYEGLSVERVKDISKLNIRSGQSALFECIRAETVKVKYGKAISASVEAGADLIDKASGNTKFNGGSRSEVSGRDLIIAYNVVTLGNPALSKESKPLKLASNGEIQSVSLMGYDIGISGYRFAEAVKSSGGVVNQNFSMTDWNRIRDEAPLEVSIRNLSNIDSSGRPFRKTASMKNESELTLELRYGQQANIITDIATIRFGYRFPKPPLTYLYEIDDLSQVTIERINTPTQILSNPAADGW